jgi:HAD superfamily hydrolase (TIGR01490 family)
MAIAFFDLDKTLLAENSTKLWIKNLWATKKISLFEMLHASYWLAKYHLGFTKLDDVIVQWLASLEGENRNEFLEVTKNFFDNNIKNIYRPGAIEAMRYHKNLGHQVSLLTSAFDGLSLLVQDDLSFDYCLCTRLEVDNQGLYTGKTVGPPCFGRNKITFAKKLCEELNTSLDQCTFYTDSASDIPLLSMVKNPVAINPDPHLRAMAQIRKWPIKNWGRP